MGASDPRGLSLHTQESIYRSEHTTDNKFYHALITNLGFGDQALENILSSGSYVYLYSCIRRVPTGFDLDNL